MIILEEDYLNEGFTDTVKEKANKFIDRTKEYGKVFLRPLQSASGAIGRMGTMAAALGGSGALVNHFVGNPLLGTAASKLATFGVLTAPFSVGAGAIKLVRDAIDDGRMSLKEFMIRRKLNAEEDARQKALKAKTAQQDAKDQVIRSYARQLVDNPSVKI